MKTVLIVEDEKLIRQGIHTMVLRSGVPIDVIMECNNGESAWEVLKEQQIDVMFTDIRMPKMDGIELVKLASTLDNPPLMVAISGYDDFSYAVEMLRNGVREYLLKPVERDKIAAVLKKLEEELAGRDKEFEQERTFGKQQLKYLLTKEDVSDTEIKSFEERYGDMFYKDDYRVCVYEKGGVKETEGNIVIVDDETFGDIAIVEDVNCSAFIARELPDSCVGFSNIHKGISELQTAYKEALLARKRAFCLGRSVEAMEDSPKIPEGLRIEAAKLIDEQYSMQRIQLIGTTRTDELDNQWEKLFIETKREHLLPEEFFGAISDFLMNVSKIYKNAISEEAHETLAKLNDILLYKNIDEYREFLTEWIVELHERIHSEDDTNSNKKLKAAVEYIEANYDKDLNMAVVSNYISMNYSMLSFLFKQYTGKNFVNYLKDIRMKEAKKLLASTDLKIIEISQKVGYENEKHFMKTFKTECGVSPSEYRKNMQRTE